MPSTDDQPSRENPICVEHLPGEARFEARLGRELAGYAAYERDGNRWVMTHTVVEDRFEGRGIGSRLAATALDTIRADGGTVIPRCEFIRAYIDDDHPADADLVAPEPG